MRSEYIANLEMCDMRDVGSYLEAREPKPVKRAQEASKPVQATSGWVGFICTLLGALAASSVLIAFVKVL